MAQYPQRPSEVDNCRDYLRTGRCKYGESCKYHHPSNVQSGGGVRTPLDPNQPPFPIRDGEPPCQYYLKHGLCKFGQACKFNHPPISPKQQGIGSSGRTSISSLSSLSLLDVYLPQRPLEPDCIYFLRNGRCKYGATCKYHHPLQLSESCGLRKVKINAPQSKEPYDSVYVGGEGKLFLDSPRSAAMAKSQESHTSSTHFVLNDGSLAIIVDPRLPDLGGSSTTNSFQTRNSGAVCSNSTATNSPMMYSPAFSSISSAYETSSNNDRLSSSLPSNLDCVHSSSEISSADYSGKLNLPPPITLPPRSNANNYRAQRHSMHYPVHHALLNPCNSTGERRLFERLKVFEAASSGGRTFETEDIRLFRARGWASANSDSCSTELWETENRHSFVPTDFADVPTPSWRSDKEPKSMHIREGSRSEIDELGVTKVSDVRQAPGRAMDYNVCPHPGHNDSTWEDGLSNMTSILLNMMDTSRNGSSDCVKPPPIARSSSIGSSTNNGLSLNADPAFRSANKTQSDHNAQHKESPVTVEPSLFPKGIHKVAVDGQHRHRSSPLWRPDSSEQQRSTTLSLYPPSNIGVYP